MRVMEFEGRSVDEAVFKGLSEMGLSIDEVKIEQLQAETKGLFGIGAKPARVRLTEKVEEEASAAPVVEAPREVEPERKPREQHEARKDGYDNRSRNDRPRSDRGAPQRHHREERDTASFTSEYNYTKEAAENLPAADFLRGLLKNMGFEAEVFAYVDEQSIRLRIDCDSMGQLIGRRGETLDALQYLTSLVVNRSRRQESYTRVTLDTENYRNKREETLRRLARKNASQVKATGRNITLEPMNPYERRIMHATLQNHPHVSTHSVGEEPNRSVVITPKR